MMLTLNDYTGSVYGGLGHLLYAYSQAQGLVIQPQLLKVQNLERFDYRIWHELLNELQQQVPRPALGLEISTYVQTKHLGILAYLALACDTLGEALNRYHDFHRLIYDGSPLQIDLSTDYLAIRWGELPQHLTTQLTDEIAIALMVQFLNQNMTTHPIQLHEVHFRHAAPKNSRCYEQFFHCKVRFSQPVTQVLLPVAELNKPLQQGDHTLQLLLMQQAQALLKQLPHSTQLDQRLQQAILTGLQKNQYHIELIAQQLNVSVRQLQRYLQAQGSNYQQRTQQVRQMLAEQYLQDPHLSLQEIALLLSYSEQSAFQRAFKLWTGQTPQQFRKLYLQVI